MVRGWEVEEETWAYSSVFLQGGEQNCQTLTGALSEDLGVEEKAVFFFPDHCLSAFLISEEVKVPPMVGLCTL